MRRLLTKGFSLVEVTIILGLLGGIGAMMMQMSRNSVNMQNEVMSSAEFGELKNEVDLILSTPSECTASLKGATFKGQTIQAKPVTIELWSGDQDGVRIRKKFSSADPEYNKSGKIIINTITFSMPDYTAAKNFNPGVESFKAEFVMNSSKTTLGKVKKNPEIKKIFMVKFTTDNNGESMIESCGAFTGASAVSNHGTLAIAAGAGHDNQTGNEACQSVQAKCSYVQSTNYISDETGCGTKPGFCVRTCATFYNKSLPGVTNGNGRDNIHSCDAKVGHFETYSDSGVACSAYFHVICNK